MVEPINIFVCHKKLLSRSKGGRKVETENAKASILHAILQSYPKKYNPWIDESEISAGMEWESEIYNRLLISDVLLVAIGPGTSDSEWVRREIALAMALGIAVLPIGFDLTKVEFGKELKGLGIDRIQGHLTQNIKFPTKDALLQEIDSSITMAAENTIGQQRKKLAPITERRNPSLPKAPDNQRAYTKEANLGGGTINLHVASGDLTKTIGIDVFVNSENDYMQMARFFESRTVSSLLRSKGARISGGQYIDAIQQELDSQIGNRTGPVQPGEVFVTSAGVPDSKLAIDNKVRYIFHVASVQAIAAQAKVVPFQQPDQIEDCVRSCLAKLISLNRSNGIVSPLGSEQRIEQERVAQNGSGKVNSILFPLFGSGQGGGSASYAISHMLSGMKRFFQDPDNSAQISDLTNIYFAAFTQPDVAFVTEALDAEF